jgi:hypothetical protein
MRKNIFKVAIFATLGLLAGYTAYSSQKDEPVLSDVVLDNIEALAIGEGNDGWYLVNVTQNSHDCIRGGYFSCL